MKKRDGISVICQPPFLTLYWGQGQSSVCGGRGAGPGPGMAGMVGYHTTPCEQTD